LLFVVAPAISVAAGVFVATVAGGGSALYDKREWQVGSIFHTWVVLGDIWRKLARF
jgi:hypothetical protein